MGVEQKPQSPCPTPEVLYTREETKHLLCVKQYYGCNGVGLFREMTELIRKLRAEEKSAGAEIVETLRDKLHDKAHGEMAPSTVFTIGLIGLVSNGLVFRNWAPDGIDANTLRGTLDAVFVSFGDLAVLVGFVGGIYELIRKKITFGRSRTDFALNDGMARAMLPEDEPVAVDVPQGGAGVSA